MLLVIRACGKKYIKSVDTLDANFIIDIVSKLLNKDNISNNTNSSELIIDESYFIYENEFVNESDEKEDEEHIGVFWITNNTLLFDDIVHTEF